MVLCQEIAGGVVVGNLVFFALAAAAWLVVIYGIRIEVPAYILLNTLGALGAVDTVAFLFVFAYSGLWVAPSKESFADLFGSPDSGETRMSGDGDDVLDGDAGEQGGSEGA